jgi:hypothetical protein
MTTVEHESADFTSRWEVRSVPDDMTVQFVKPPEDDPEDKDDPGNYRILEVYWGGESKVSAELDIFDGIASIDRIGRPQHWGEDTRPASEQEAEYTLGLELILKKVAAIHKGPIEVNSQKGVVAGAMLDLKHPSGMKRYLKIERYESGWHDSEQIDLRQAIGEGAQLAARYEKETPPQPGLGVVAIGGALAEAPVTLRVA